MENKILSKNKKIPPINKAVKKPNANHNSRTKSSSLTNLPLKKVTKKRVESEQAPPLDTAQNCGEGSSKQSNGLNSAGQASGSNCRDDVNLDSPRLCSALKLAEEIKSARAKAVPNIKLGDLQKEIKHKVGKKTNVPFSEHIFHDLVDLEINDEVSGKKTSSKLPEFSRNKDKVFQLEDYYKPNFSTEFCPKVPFKKREIEMVQHYDGFEIWNRLVSLNQTANN